MGEGCRLGEGLTERHGLHDVVDVGAICATGHGKSVLLGICSPPPSVQKPRGGIRRKKTPEGHEHAHEKYICRERIRVGCSAHVTLERAESPAPTVFCDNDGR